jgi:hypothetical protein
MTDKQLRSKALKIAKGNMYVAEEIMSMSLLKAVKNKAENLNNYAASALLHSYLNFSRHATAWGADYHNDRYISYDRFTADEDTDPSTSMDIFQTSLPDQDVRADVARLLDFVDTLPKRQRDAFYFRLEHGCQAHIEERVNNHNTQKANFRHAMLKIREAGYNIWE